MRPNEEKVGGIQNPRVIFRVRNKITYHNVTYLDWKHFKFFEQGVDICKTFGYFEQGLLDLFITNVPRVSIDLQN